MLISWFTEYLQKYFKNKVADMILNGAIRERFLILAQLSSVLFFISCISTSRKDSLIISSDTQTTVQTKEESQPSPKEDKISLESLPRDHFYIDWVKAVKGGYINPKGSIDDEDGEEILFNLDILFTSDDLFMPDVVFSHATHTYWLNCETCHPKIFIPRRGINYFTMQDIWDGKYCGACHGKVAFPTQITSGLDFTVNCIKCHSRERR